MKITEKFYQSQIPDSSLHYTTPASLRHFAEALTGLNFANVVGLYATIRKQRVVDMCAYDENDNIVIFFSNAPVCQ